MRIPLRPSLRLSFVAFLWLVAGSASIVAGSASTARADLIVGWGFSDLPGDGAILPPAYPATHVGPGASGTLTVVAGGPGIATDFDGGLVCGETGLVGGIQTFAPGAPTFGGPEFLGLTTAGMDTTRIELAYAAADEVAMLRIHGGVTTIPRPGTPPGMPVKVDVWLSDCAGTSESLGSLRVDTQQRPIDIVRFDAPRQACVVFEYDASEADLVFDNLALSGLVGVAFSDADADRVPDAYDNCTVDPNGPWDTSSQQDSDRDGYGNACDADYNQDDWTTTLDFALWISDFTRATSGVETDHNGDCVTTTLDFSRYLAAFQGIVPAAGPTGLVCAGGPDPCTPDWGALEGCVPWPFDPLDQCSGAGGPF